MLGVDDLPFAYLDMGWEEPMVAVEYEGDQHRTDRRQYVKDIRRIETLERMGWIVVRVVAACRRHERTLDGEAGETRPRRSAKPQNVLVGRTLFAMSTSA